MVGYSSTVTTPRSHDVALAPQAESADHRQAQHLRAMLVIQLEELDAVLANYGSALERYQRRGERTQTRRVRGLIRNAERERRSVQQLITRLDDRFGPAETNRAEGPRSAPPSSRPAARVHPYPTPHRVIRA